MGMSRDRRAAGLAAVRDLRRRLADGTLDSEPPPDDIPPHPRHRPNRPPSPGSGRWADRPDLN